MLNQGSELVAGLVCVLLKTKYLSCSNSIGSRTVYIAWSMQASMIHCENCKLLNTYICHLNCMFVSHIEKLPETQRCMLMALHFNNGEPAGVLREIHHGEIHHKPEELRRVVAPELHLSNSRKQEGVACETARMRICIFLKFCPVKIAGSCKYPTWTFPVPESEGCSRQTC